MVKEENNKQTKTSNSNFSLCPAGDKCVDCQCKSPLPPGCDCDPGDLIFCFDLIWFSLFDDMLIPPGCDCDPGDLNFLFYLVSFFSLIGDMLIPP